MKLRCSFCRQAKPKRPAGPGMSPAAEPWLGLGIPCHMGSWYPQLGSMQTALLVCLPTDGCLASSLPRPAHFSGKETMLRAAELLSCVLRRRACHAPDTSNRITLSPNGSAGTLLQKSAVLGRFLTRRVGPTGASGVGCSSQLADGAPTGSRDPTGV